MINIKSIEDVSKNRLCTGCGNCAFALSEKIEMVETTDENRRPVSLAPLTKDDKKIIKNFCPALNNKHKLPTSISAVEKAWGPVLEVWEGYSSCPETRHYSSSGGAITALGLYMLSRDDCDGVLHIKARKDIPYLNEAAYSQNNRSLKEGCGSRYAPASICDRLDLVTKQKNQSMVVGKPCEVKAIKHACNNDPELRNKIAVSVSIFCAGVPSHKGTSELLKTLRPRVNATSLNALKYRGDGWPGDMVAEWNTITGKTNSMAVSYEYGWGEILQKHRQWRCHTCEDHTGEWSDISVGDPWQNPITDKEKGKSLIVIRTEKGRELFHKAMQAGYIIALRKEDDILFKAQPNLFKTKGAVWGRIAALKLLGINAPFMSKEAFYCWLRLPFKQKIQSILGTLKRANTKNLFNSKSLHQMKGIRK